MLLKMWGFSLQINLNLSEYFPAGSLLSSSGHQVIDSEHVSKLYQNTELGHNEIMIKQKTSKQISDSQSLLWIIFIRPTWFVTFLKNKRQEMSFFFPWRSRNEASYPKEREER